MATPLSSSKEVETRKEHQRDSGQKHAEVGVASTLMALPPVIVLPISYFIFKEKVGWQAIAGTLLAIAGVAVLFLA